MADEVHFAWITGRTLTFGVYQEDGTQREVGTGLTEAPGGSGNYVGSPSTIVEGDTVVVSDPNGVIGGGQYWLDTMADTLNSVSIRVGKTMTVIDETETEEKSFIEI